MWTSFLIAVAVWGTDPEIVFSDTRARCTTPDIIESNSLAATPMMACHRSLSEDSFVFPAKTAASTKRLGTAFGGAPKKPFQSRSLDGAPLLISQSTLTRSPGSKEAPCIVRGQTVANDACVPLMQPEVATFWENPFVKEFISGMNPFVHEDLHLIPNYYDPYGIQMGTGSFGRQGYRMGWVSYNDMTILPASPAIGTAGNMKVVEWNSNTKYSHLIAPGVLFNGTGIFNARWWDGPSGIPLPGQVDEISTDLELGFFNDGPFSGQLAFHPQIVETYEGRLDWNAFNFDGRAVGMYQASPQWSFVAGVAFWDRLTVLVVPHVGVIWTPNDRWEFRILFPRSRISYFLGNWKNGDWWVYGTAEYAAEAYQSSIPQAQSSDRVQLTDDRLALGLRWDTGRYSFFAEGGYYFNRQVRFAGSTPSFNLSDSGMLRVGMRY